MVYKNSCLNALHACLTDALEIIKHSAPNNDGIVLNEEEGMQEQIKVQRKAAVANVHQTSFVELPKRKSRRSKFTGRVGEGVMKRKPAMKVSINEIYTPQSETTGIEEPVPVVPDTDDYVLPLHLANYSSLPPEGTNQQSASDTDLESDVELTMPDQDDYDDVVITDVKDPSETPASLSKRRKLLLSEEEEDVILNEEELSDESINIAQNMINSQYPDYDGLEDTVIGQCQMFSTFKCPFIQILYTGKRHWICVSGNSTESPNKVYVQDSLSSGRITTNVAKQIACFMNCQEPEIEMEIVPLKQQTNGTN